jgi:hypothetical protein
VTTIRTGQPRIHCSIPGSGKRLCFPLRHPRWLWCLASLPSNVNWGLSVRVYSYCSAKLTTYLYLVPCIMSGAVSPLHHTLIWSAGSKLCFVLYITYVMQYVCMYFYVCVHSRLYIYIYVCVSLFSCPPLHIIALL